MLRRKQVVKYLTHWVAYLGLWEALSIRRLPRKVIKPDQSLTEMLPKPRFFLPVIALPHTVILASSQLAILPHYLAETLRDSQCLCPDLLQTSLGGLICLVPDLFPLP
jgi:hypothetical protein